MMNNKKITRLSAILFFGACFGIVEATLGYVLHLEFITPFLAGSLLFPFAMLLLAKAYQVTQSRGSVIAVGIVAALIKSINFFLPYTNPFRIINPMIAIVIESLLVFAVIQVMTKSTLPKQLAMVIGLSFAWRVVYIAYFGIQSLFPPHFVAWHIQSLGNFSSFVLVEGLLSGLFGSLLWGIDSVFKKPAFSWSKSPVFSSIMVGLAIVLTILL